MSWKPLAPFQSNEKLISASERYFDIEESPEVKDLLAQNYLEALEEIEEEDDDITVQLQVSREQSKVALHLQALTLVDWRKIGVSSEAVSSAELAYAQDLFLTLKAAVEAASGNSSRSRDTRKTKQMSLHDYHDNKWLFTVQFYCIDLRLLYLLKVTNPL